MEIMLPLEQIITGMEEFLLHVDYANQLGQVGSKCRHRTENKLYYKLLAAICGRQWPVQIDEFYLEKILLQQNNKCNLSGVTFSELFPISVDRIDSTKGYIEGNVQLVLKEINYMKSNMPQSLFLLLCNAVAKTHPEK